MTGEGQYGLTQDLLDEQYHKRATMQAQSAHIAQILEQFFAHLSRCRGHLQRLALAHRTPRPPPSLVSTTPTCCVTHSALPGKSWFYWRRHGSPNEVCGFLGAGRCGIVATQLCATH